MTKEELDKQIIDLEKRKQMLELKRLEYIQGDNFDYSFINMMEIDKTICEIEEQLDAYDFYYFGRSYIYYILSIINSVEDTNEDNYYEMIDFSNQNISSFSKEWRSNYHTVSVIARHNDLEIVKKKHFDSLYHSHYGIDEYDLRLIPIINSIDGLIVNITTSKDYAYVSDVSRPAELVFIKEVFADKFPYIHEFLTLLFAYRLQTGKKDIEISFILGSMKMIIEKYTSKSKKKKNLS